MAANRSVAPLLNSEAPTDTQPSFSSAFRSFWHTMTSNDRHASHDSPYRTGSHMPVSQSRHAPLTSIATSATESQQDLSEHGDSKRPSISSTQVPLPSPGRPYSPGMRSVSSPKVPQTEETPVSPGEIQMQSFADGAPPPPHPHTRGRRSMGGLRETMRNFSTTCARAAHRTTSMN